MLQFMGSQRVRQNLATEQKQQEYKRTRERKNWMMLQDPGWGKWGEVNKKRWTRIFTVRLLKELKVEKRLTAHQRLNS